MAHLRQLKKQTSSVLAGLGSNADEVAANLQGAGVRGVPASNRSCAVALYLGAVMGSETWIRSIAVGPCSLLITLVEPTHLRPAGHLLVQLPKPVRQFVAAFDARQYPGLTREPAAPPAPATVA
ncbi:MAG: hypothetical protein ACLQPH_22485 [Acidimicrobiales bacterium]